MTDAEQALVDGLEAMEESVAHNLFLAGQLLAATLGTSGPDRIKLLTKQIDPNVLQAFLDTKPEGFLYADQIAEVIRLAKTFKSFGQREIESSVPPGQGQ